MPRDSDPDTRRTPGTDAAAPAARPRRRLNEEAHRRLGRDLRRHYAGVLEQPLPERLARLVDELAATIPDREGSR